MCLAKVLSATSAGESPSRRWPYSTRKLRPETRWIAESNSLTVVPWPVPKFKATLSPPLKRCSTARVWASAKSKTWTKSRIQEPSRVLYRIP